MLLCFVFIIRQKKFNFCKTIAWLPKYSIAFNFRKSVNNRETYYYIELVAIQLLFDHHRRLFSTKVSKTYLCRLRV